jgi:aspartyl-tRNA(Asn)/glutamyl-tRNA(Gln) amidotransferase subunit C
MEIKDVEKLAQLARIELSGSEKEALLGDLKSILGYIDQIEKVTIQGVGPLNQDSGVRPLWLRNVMREDKEPHETGINTNEILESMPSEQDGFLKVQSIL